MLARTRAPRPTPSASRGAFETGVPPPGPRGGRACACIQSAFLNVCIQICCIRLYSERRRVNAFVCDTMRMHRLVNTLRLYQLPQVFRSACTCIQCAFVNKCIRVCCIQLYSAAPPCECACMQLTGRMHPKSYAHVCVGRECKVVHSTHIRVHYMNVAFIRILFHSITLYTHAYLYVFAASCIHMHTC